MTHLSPSAPRPLAESLTPLLRDLARGWGERAPLLLWPLTAGAGLAARARAVRVEQNVLWIAVADPAWLHQFVALRRELLPRINAHLGTPLRDLRFFLAAPEGPQA